MAAANIAAALASREARSAVLRPLDFKVALIDLDVFSAGTHRVFEIPNSAIQKLPFRVQDFLLHEIEAADYVSNGGITLAHEAMQTFIIRGGRSCREDFTLFPAAPEPDRRFIVQKYHENNLIGLLRELQQRGFDYVILDGESGTRAMADIAIRLADVVLMFFRLTWQHIEGSLSAMRAFLQKPNPPAFYLIPACVPLIAPEDCIYQPAAPGLEALTEMTERIPRDSQLNELAEECRNTVDGNEQAYGYFWARRACIHDSLVLKGEERVLVYDNMIANERAARDYYHIAEEISRLQKPR